MKEYGGFIQLELPKQKEYFDTVEEKDILRLNCGRSTFYCAAKDAKIKKIYMPYLNCLDSPTPFLDLGIQVEYYYLEEDLTPKDVFLKENEAILWVNYYGNASENIKQKVLNQYKTLIIDNCHAFFSPPIKNVYNCYSTRKFFGVADGAYLIKDNLEKIELSESNSADATLFLLKTIELGTNAVYQENLKNEVRVAKTVSKMSPLTRRILSSINYETVREIRYRNLLMLHKNLNDINEFKVNLESKTHMYYPLLVSQESLRSRLVANKIYTPTWWKHVPEQCHYRKLETKLSNYMLMIPIDQRYDENDMIDIATIIRNNLE
ncbi:hypothetical protein D3Z55_22495 [Clostridiaceae bacterium]|jgi:hypothetical protein|nr:hypothetical protein [Lachnospiraceae bacterium]NBH20083.1 hypothetical protein [Clostridiaceae bacterium]